MPRISKDISSQIVKNVMTHTFRDDTNQLVSDRAAFMAKLYEELWDETTRKRVAAVPAGWIMEDDDLQFKSMAETFDVAWSGWVGQWGAHEWTTYGDKPAHIYKRVPTASAKRNIIVELPAASPLNAEWEVLRARSMELDARIKTARAATIAAIGQCTTIKQLIKSWPEIRPFAEPWNTPDERRLPVVQTAKLNELLDLPVGDELNVVLKIGEPA